MVKALPTNQKEYLATFNPSVAIKKWAGRQLLYHAMQELGQTALFSTLHHTPNGKLMCDGYVYCSLSYAANFICCGVTLNTPCGIDMVQQSPLDALGNIYYLNESDNQSIAIDRNRFYFFHSRYEALIKLGVIEPWQEIDFSLTPNTLLPIQQTIHLGTKQVDKDLLISLASTFETEIGDIITYTL